MFDFDKVPSETSALGSQMVAALDFYGCNDDYKDYDLELFFLNALQHL